MNEFYEENIKNRMLILNEYDDDGNLIDSRTLDDRILSMFICSAISSGMDIDIARKSVVDNFSSDEWSVIRRIIGVDFNVHHYSSKYHGLDFYDDNTIELFKEILCIHSIDVINFAIDEICLKGFKCKLASCYSGKMYGFDDALSFIYDRDGMYCAINNSGERTYDFVEVPTRKQAEYRFKKYGDNLVYIDFYDFTVHHVDYSELSST